MYIYKYLFMWLFSFQAHTFVRISRYMYERLYEGVVCHVGTWIQV